MNRSYIQSDEALNALNVSVKYSHLVVDIPLTGGAMHPYIIPMAYCDSLDVSLAKKAITS